MAFVCVAVQTSSGNRWECVDYDTAKVWLTGPDYLYKNLKASQVTGTKTRIYSSTTWPSSLTLNPDQNYNRMRLIDVGDGTASISNGIMTAGGNSPRVYYDGPWRNVEFASDVKAVSNVSQTYLIGRSSHQVNPCGFGGYDYYIDIPGKDAFFKKEIHHHECPEDGLKGYSSRLASVKVPVEPNVWYRQKLRVTNIENNTKVKLEAFFNNVKVTELIDSGNILCSDEKTPAITTEQKWCYTRANRDDDSKGLKVQYKNLYIRPI